MEKNHVYNKKKLLVTSGLILLLLLMLIGRLGYLMLKKGAYYSEKAQILHERERDIKAARGEILDCNGNVLAANKTVCTISLIHSQIQKPEEVVSMLVKELNLSKEEAQKRVDKISSIEKIKSNVKKEVGDRIRNYELSGVKVDEDYQRYYPYESLASKVLGFTGADNQGIVGLEVEYESVLKGTDGKILTVTDAKGVEQEAEGERRQEPVVGKNLHISLDINLQSYAQQQAEKVMTEKQADGASVIIMNPQDGSVYAMVNVPEFNLNNPYELESENLDDEAYQEALNQMWRNRCISDTYEPGSTFKIFTSAAGLEAGVVTTQDSFSCPGYRVVEDRRIHCHNRRGHGSENFIQGIENSCNPVFIDVGLRLGVDGFFKYLKQFGVMEQTGVDLPGEAKTIMHKKKNVGLVELATMSFGQSFQITPIQLAVTASAVINGGRRVTPHLALYSSSGDRKCVEKLIPQDEKQVLSEATSSTMRMLLESVVANGSGKNGGLEGYRIGGKTATSQTLPRSANRYISSFLGFAPADNPQVLVLCIVYNPTGIYYGSMVVAPVVRDIFSNILPYMGIEKTVDN